MHPSSPKTDEDHHISHHLLIVDRSTIMSVLTREPKRSLLTVLLLLSCPFVSAFTPIKARNTCCCCPFRELQGKRPVVADVSDVWPTAVDDEKWVQHWEEEPTYCNYTRTLYPTSNNDSWVLSISNINPTWERIVAKVIPEPLPVTPAFAILAPRGGCDNLCNEEERYSDTITFSVPYNPNARWLMIRTEGDEWVYFLGKERPML